MYRPQIDNWHDKDSNPMDVDTPKRLSEPETVSLSAETIVRIAEAVTDTPPREDDQD